MAKISPGASRAFWPPDSCIISYSSSRGKSREATGSSGSSGSRSRSRGRTGMVQQHSNGLTIDGGPHEEGKAWVSKSWNRQSFQDRPFKKVYRKQIRKAQRSLLAGCFSPTHGSLTCWPPPENFTRTLTPKQIKRSACVIQHAHTHIPQIDCFCMKN